MKHILRKLGFLLLTGALLFGCDGKKQNKSTVKNTKAQITVTETAPAETVKSDTSKITDVQATPDKTVEQDTPEVPDKPIVLQEVNTDDILKQLQVQSASFELYATAEACVLYEDAGTKSKQIITLPENTVVKIIGEDEQKKGKWKQVETFDNKIGWSLANSLKPIETTAKAIALEIMDRKAGAYPTRTDYRDVSFDSTNISEEIEKKQGLYIQQNGRNFQGKGHAPEILKLAVEDNRVFVSEINIVDGKVLEFNKIEFIGYGTSYSHDKSSIKSYNGNIVIFYLEHTMAGYWEDDWDYKDAYTFAAPPNDFLNPAIFSLTTDYLNLYTGDYDVDSIEIITEENMKVDVEKIKNSKITITYDGEQKCLSCPYSQLLPGSPDKAYPFVETSPKEPFFWMYGESVGFVERKAWFYNGGIALTEELHTCEFDNDHNVIADINRKYTVFYKKIQ